ncbi:MAG TPA: hypothetical protein VGB10_04270 [Bacteroidota bacterium]
MNSMHFLLEAKKMFRLRPVESNVMPFIGKNRLWVDFSSLKVQTLEFFNRATGMFCAGLRREQAVE